jgi:CBS domain-containing protein
MRKMSDLVRDRRPLTLPPNATVTDAARQMRERRVGAALVPDGVAGLVGISTGRDAIDRVLAKHNAIEALRLMQDTRCRHLPIVDAGKLLGIVSRGDFRWIELDRLDEETGLWERTG